MCVARYNYTFISDMICKLVSHWMLNAYSKQLSMLC